MKKHFYLTIICSLLITSALAQEIVQGVVSNGISRQPLENVTIRTSTNNQGVTTDKNGNFSIRVKSPVDTLIVTHIGFLDEKIIVNDSNKDNPISIILHYKNAQLDEVFVSTGYYTLPKERATGSFEHIDNELFNRSVGSNIISRLEGIVPSLQFDRRLAGDHISRDNSQSLRLRGAGTLFANSEPLIILDNFPYEGSIDNINPNNVESITILKDAAAASIWGARAGNGVIVITTKKGKFNESLRLSFNSNLSIFSTPNLFYNQNYIESKDYIELEKTLFNANSYLGKETDINMPVLSPVVETLIKLREGELTSLEAETYFSLLASNDLRKDATNHLYRRGINQQYSLSLSGGSEKHSYLASGGFDKNISSYIGNHTQRITLNTLNNFKLGKHIEVFSEIAIVRNLGQANAVDIRSLPVSFPYLSLKNINGDPNTFPRDYRESYKETRELQGLDDWFYRPLQELDLNNVRSSSNETRLNYGFRYNLGNDWKFSANYQFQQFGTKGRTLHDEQSYHVRTLVNRFTQEDGTKIFPEGAILSLSDLNQKIHSIRGQVNYNKDFNERHSINALAGFEIRQSLVRSESSTLYGYDDETLTSQPILNYTQYYNTTPQGISTIPFPPFGLGELLDRTLSYFGNLGYSYEDKYIFSFSTRWDASNLYGVDTNQKGVPLWSVGASWMLHREKFFQNEFLPFLKLRGTFGYNGNTDKSITAYPTVSYVLDYMTNFRSGTLRSPGNPNLRWEKVQMLNFGIDFSTKNSWVSGSIDYYRKKSSDLLGEMLIDPTIFWGGGMGQYRVNYADLLAQGIDLNLHSAPIGKEIKWSGNFILGYSKNRVLRYFGSDKSSVINFTRGTGVRPIEGASIDAMYSLPWAGLDPKTGDPLVNENGELTKNYTNYLNGLTIGDLVNHGSSVPLIQGGFRNTFFWKGLSASINTVFKTNYYFRRSTIHYNSLINNWNVHQDYYDRWQQPGDENRTPVPSLVTQTTANRDEVYSRSTALVEKGDHIRIQDINLSYTFKNTGSPKNPFRDITIYSYATNLGIIWRANKKKIDPDYPYATILPPKMFSFGIKANL